MNKNFVVLLREENPNYVHILEDTAETMCGMPVDVTEVRLEDAKHSAYGPPKTFKRDQGGNESRKTEGGFTISI
jgi:hypothetical protein